MIKLLLQRSSIHFFGLLCSKLLGIGVFILLARLLTPTVFGEVAYYVTILSLITIFADFGLSHWYQKTLVVAQKKTLLGKMVAARMLLFFVSAIFVLLYSIFFTRYSPLLSGLLLVTLLPEALLSVFDGYYLAEKKPLPISVKQAVRAVFLLIGGAVLGSGLTIEWVAFFVLLAAVANVAWFVPFSRFELRWRSILQSPAVLRQSFQYAILIATSYVYARGDSIIIQKSLGSAALGVYSAAYRYLEGLSMLPTALAQNLFHIAARDGAVTKKELLQIVALLFVLGLGSMLGMIVFAQFLTVSLLGQAYASAAYLVQLMGIVSFLFFCNAPLGAVIQSSRLLPQFVPWGIANTILNVALNLMFVPQYGVVAAVYVLIGTELLGLAINMYFVRMVYRKGVYELA